KLREVEIFPAVETLLVEIHRADADLPVVKIRREEDDKIIRAHVAEEADEAALVEFHELLGDADGAEVLVVQPAVDENIAGETDDVLLDERVAVREEIEAI